MKQLSFDFIQSTCQTLDAFVKARETHDKDVILRVQKTAGGESLVITRVSQLSLKECVIRWLGWGDATLTSVEHFLRENEPYLPFSFSRLKGDTGKYFIEMLQDYYTQTGVVQMRQLTEQRYEELKRAKMKGYELFKRCLCHHNKNSIWCKVYGLFQEYEKRDLFSLSFHPLGALSPQDPESNWRERFKVFCLDSTLEEFEYLSPFFRKPPGAVLAPNTLGFCYEYGLGVKQDLKKAEECYEKAVKEEREKMQIQMTRRVHAAFYNWARFLFLYEPQQEPDIMKCLTEAEEILKAKLTQVKLPNEIYCWDEFDKQEWKKDLRKVYELLVKVYEGDEDRKKIYEKKLQQATEEKSQ